MHGEEPADDQGPDLSPLGARLSPEEDDELRRLDYLQQFGELSESRRERLLELRLRDRRESIREPQESLVHDDEPAGEESGTSFRFVRDRH